MFKVIPVLFKPPVHGWFPVRKKLNDSDMINKNQNVTWSEEIKSKATWTKLNVKEVETNQKECYSFLTAYYTYRLRT